MVVWGVFFMFFWFFFCLLLDLGKGVRIEEKKRDFEGFGEGEMWDEEKRINQSQNKYVRKERMPRAILIFLQVCMCVCCGVVWSSVVKDIDAVIDSSCLFVCLKK